MDNKKIIDKILKLLALADNNPNREEAESAKAKAAELMAQYNIAQEKLVKDEPIEFVYRAYVALPTWRYRLVAAVCQLSGVALVNQSSRKNFVYVGRQHDIEIALHMVDQIALQIEAYGRVYRKKLSKRTKNPTEATNAYREGLVTGVIESLWRLAEDVLAYKRQEGLVPVSETDKRFTEARKAMVEKFQFLKTHSFKTESGRHAKTGRGDAEHIRLRSGVGSSAAQKKLTSK